MLRRALLLIGLVLLTPGAAHAAITIQPAQAVEGQPLKFSVKRASILDGAATASTRDGSAKASEDYVPLANEAVSFNGSGDATVTVDVKIDATPEMDETVLVDLKDVQGKVIATGTGTIKNDDQPSLGVGEISVSEGAGAATVTITSQPVSADVTVAFATGDDSAKAGEDYTATSGRATIKAGQGSTTFRVPIADDGTDEDDERLGIKLGSAEGAGIGDGDGSITITNDDGRLVSIGDAGVTEADGEQSTARVPVQLSGPTFRTVSVAFVTIDSTAKAPRDYLARYGSVTFQPGQTTQFIDVAIAADDAVEQSEFFGILIGQAQGAKVLRGAAVVAVTDDDANDRNGADSQAPRMQLTRPRLSGSRSIRAKVTCPRGEQRCNGRLVLYAKAGKGEKRIGSKTFSLPGDASRTLRITIPKAFVTRARRSGKLQLRAYMVTSDAADNVDTTTKSATLRFRRSR